MPVHLTYLISGEKAGETLASLESGLAHVATSLEEGRRLVQESHGAGRTLGATTIKGVEYSVIVGPVGGPLEIAAGWVNCLENALRTNGHGLFIFLRGGARLVPGYAEAVTEAFSPETGAVYGDRMERGVRRFAAPFVWEKFLTNPRIYQSLAVRAELVSPPLPHPGLLLPRILFDVSKHHLVSHLPRVLSEEPVTEPLNDEVLMAWNDYLRKMA